MPFHKILTQTLQKLHIPWRHLKCQPTEQVLPSSSLSTYAVVFVDFWPDVTDKGQEVVQDFIPVLLEVGLEDVHLLLGFLLHFSAATAVGSQSLSGGVRTHRNVRNHIGNPGALVNVNNQHQAMEPPG